ncbi:MAG: hypothetical protein B6D39_01115 [Anaerolineae bacterium UTCFX2]|jgi:hypothetical protein|nr:hypothetical protein [Anaerolineae bacterium]MCZ7553109.1 hypothetical protein [Anaerolineales bacterium]OQY94679.1 MAG: hypothetical protein B6D39_01115 [Anaerolineae bacterium UTCFX2]
MTTRISPRDWEALSSYLDNQLSSIERNRLELRLEVEPELRGGLKELRRTRLIVREAGRYRAPRNFTLSPSMVGQKRGTSLSSGAYPVLRLASMLATLFFVLITAGSLVAQLTQSPQAIVMSSERENALNAPAVGMGGGGGSGESEAPAFALAPTLEIQTAEMEAGSPTSAADVREVTPLAIELATPTPPAMEAFAAPLESEATDSAAAGEEPAAKAYLVQPGAETKPQAAGRNYFTFIIVIQAALLLLALITGVLAYLVRRNIIS